MATPPGSGEIDRPTGKTYWFPTGTQRTEYMPAGGLTASGQWVPLFLADDGSVIISEEGNTTPAFNDALEDVTPGAEQTLASETVPAGFRRLIHQVLVVTRVSGAFQVLSGTDVIGSGRTGPGCSGVMPFNPPRPMAPGTNYKVLFTSRLNAPVQDVECYVQAADVPI
jgi:hypothetical protein